jgi:hypothetical protein
MSLSCLGRQRARRPLPLSHVSSRPAIELAGREERVDLLDRDRALSDGRGHTLDRPVSHVAGREDSRHAGCEMEGTAPERPPAIVREVLAGQHESAPVSLDLMREPIGVRAGSDQHEEPVCRDRLVGRGAVLAQHEMLKTPVTAAVDDRRSRANLDVGDRLQLLHQVVRHPRLQRLSAHDQRDAAGVARQVQSGLSRRVRASDDVGLSVSQRVARCRPAVEHARAVEGFECRDSQPAVARPGAEDHRPRADAAPAGQCHPRPDELPRRLA